MGLRIDLGQTTDFTIAATEDEKATGPDGGDLSTEMLLIAWEDCKARELTANQQRLLIESQLALRLSAPAEGQKTHRVGAFKVVLTNAVYYRGDVNRLIALAAELELPPLHKNAVDETALKRLRKSHPVDFELLVSEGAVTVNPAKPHFAVSQVATADLAT